MRARCGGSGTLCAGALAVVLGLLVLAGCGGGGETAATEPTASEGEAGEAGTTSGGEADPGATGGEAEATGPAEADPGATGGGGEATAPAGSEAPAEFLALESFQSPSGNIGCVLSDGEARCDAAKHSWAAPRPADCPAGSDAGQGLYVGAAGEAGVVCAGDTTLDDSAPVLAYGTAAEGGGTVCVSRRAGLTCTNGDGHGFTIGAQAYKLF